MNEQDISEQIESYLSGEMTGEALKQFDQKIKSDQELAAQVDLYRDIDTVLADDGAFALQQQTDALGEDFFGAPNVVAKPARFKVYRRSWAIAATVLLLIVGGWVWWSASDTASLSGTELFATNYEAPVFSNTVRGDDPQADDYVRAVEAYRANNLAEAEQLFKDHINAKPTDIRASFGLASVYLQQQPPALAEAARYFQAVIDQGESLWVDKSKWYLALIRLQQADKAAAQGLLQELLVSEDKELAKQAQTLLSKGY